jgi:hypothetical protein
MKKIFLSVISIFILSAAFSQISETTIRKINIGLGVYNDFWQSNSPDMDIRTINQGAQVFGMYHYRIKNSVIYLAGGIGLGVHNLYSNTIIPDVKADSIMFEKIPDNVDYKKSKITLAYIDLLPFEFRIKTKKHFRIAVGFKLGFLVNAHAKYKGNRYSLELDDGQYEFETEYVRVKEKQKDLKQVEIWRYGPTFRIGYKWINLIAYYQLSNVFKVDKGPEIYPISVGLAIIPF